jgi:very-short-patch-repair endonuclease
MRAPAESSLLWSQMRLEVPAELRDGPFTVSEARRIGFKWRSLQANTWRRLSRGQYAWTQIPDDTELQLKAAQRRLPSQFAFSGRTAAWILGLDLSPCDPIEAIVPRNISVRCRTGMRVRRASLAEGDVIQRRGFRLTNTLRTLTDLGSDRDLVESVVALDLALHAGLIGMEALKSHIEKSSGAKGVRRLRRAVSLADSRSESPMETRLRVQLVCARLPAPEVQVELHDKTGRFLGRADLYYSDVKLVVEFDGQNHKDRIAADLRRQNALLNAGYHVLRFTAADLHVKGSVAAQVRSARNLLRQRAR